MRKVIFMMSAVLLSVVLMQSCKPSDEKVQKAVDAVLTATVPGVTATVKDQVVTLTGTVESEQQKASAETAVKSVKDVKSVVNNIVVEPPVVINPDDTITTTITTALNAAGFKTVNVSVKDGEVTLTGDVKKADLKKVMQVANESNPKKVINQLNVK